MSVVARSRFVVHSLAVGLALVLAGCAGLPTSSSVERVDVGERPADAVVRYQPAPPQPGDSPQAIVRGFLDAMLAYPVSTATAAEYLTPQAAEDWQASAGVRIYRDPVVRTTASTDQSATDQQVTVQVTAKVDASLDAAGHYAATPQALAESLPMERVDGQWRIAQAPSGVLITSTYFSTYYRALDTYFFDARGSQLVADPVHVPIGEQLANGLMASLVAGPPPALAPQARTYLPSAATWRPAVTIGDDGIADVEFRFDFNGLGAGARNRLAAQVVRTLEQVPGVRGTRISGLSGPLVVDDRTTQAVGSWARFGADEPRGRPGALIGATVVELREGERRDLTLPQARGADPADPLGIVEPAAVAVADDAVAVAGADAVAVSFSGDPAVQVPSTDVVGLTWDSGGVLWVMDRPGGVLRIRLVTAESVTSVATPPLTGVTSLSLDAGARRYALTSEADPGAIFVGLVRRDAGTGTISLADPTAVRPGPSNLAQVNWTGPSTVVFIGDVPAGRQAFAAGIDGAAVDDAESIPRLPEVGVRRLAADAEGGLYLTDDRDRIWFRPADGSWRLTGVVTAALLSSGR